MDTEQRPGGKVLHYNASDPADLAALIENGMIWQGPAKAQQAAISAILRGDAQPGANMPPEVEAFIAAHKGGASEPAP